MNKYVTEFLGTFFLVLTVLCTAVYGPDAGFAAYLTPFAIGASLMVMVYAGGHISGAHYNPAVTLGVLVRGRCKFGDAIAYWVSQALAAAAAYAVAGQLFAKKIAAAATAAAPAAADAVAVCPVSEWGVPATILAEFLFTFALVYVVLNVATAKANAGTGFYGLAIGMTVTVGACAVGGISGGAFNPAVALGVALTGKVAVLSCCTIWMHLVGQALAAVVAGLLFRALNSSDK